MDIAFIVREFIDKYNYRDPIFIEELNLDKSQNNARDYELYKLEYKGIIRQYQKGIYYKPKVTRFGELGIDKEKLIEYKYLKNKDGKVEGYITGPSVWYNLNITTQVPRNKWIVSNKVNHTKIEDDLFIKVFAPKKKINDKLVKYFLLLDIIDQCRKIQDMNNKKYDEFIMNTIKGYKSEDFLIIKRLSKDYDRFVRRVLGMYIEILYNNCFKYNFIEDLNLEYNKKLIETLELVYNDLKSSVSADEKYYYRVINDDIKKGWGLY